MQFAGRNGWDILLCMLCEFGPEYLFVLCDLQETAGFITACSYMFAVILLLFFFAKQHSRQYREVNE